MKNSETIFQTNFPNKSLKIMKNYRNYQANHSNYEKLRNTISN